MSSQPTSKLKSGAHTSMVAVDQAKGIKCVYGDRDRPVDIHKAPVSRIYTKDYSKVSEAGDKDDVTVYLGNPLRW